ncbi:MAG: serine/threonine-protein phosphatase [Anaerolineae bacterium]|nr:serine/threonine-protein phosphatase [Anaerolineae bacterium]
MQIIDKIEGLQIGHGTHEGMSGKSNEDSYGFFAWDSGDGKPLYVGVVADGVGGQTAGEIASTLSVSAVQEYFRRQEKINGNLSGHLERAILAANKAVYDYSQGHSEVSGMGTTMVAAAIFEQKLYTAYVGDSRIYLLREGSLQQITVDHTWAQEAIQIGLLTREQAKTHPNRNVIKRFLGGFPEVEVDHRLVIDAAIIDDAAKANQGLPLQPGDIVLLCSDGLSDMIDDATIQGSILSYPNQLQAATQDLINKANQAGGRDNITVLLLQIPGKPKTSLFTTGRMPRVTTSSMPAVTAAPTSAAAALPVQPKPRRSRLPYMLAGLALFILIPLAILAIIAGGSLLARQNNHTSVNDTQTIPATNEGGSNSSDTTPSSSQATTSEAATLGIIEITPNSTNLPGTPDATGSALEPTPTIGLIPTNTNTPTFTPRPPTATPTHTLTPSPTPTDTPEPLPQPPGNEPQPTATYTPDPSNER